MWTPSSSHLDPDSHGRPFSAVGSDTPCLVSLLFSCLVVHFALRYLMALVLNSLEEEEDLLLVKTKIAVCNDRYV